MRLSENGLKLIQAWEGIEDGDPSTVNYEPYICPANVYTVGWGHALTTPSGQIIDRDVFGPSRARELARQAMQRKFGRQSITLSEAKDLLRQDVGRFERAVEKMLGSALRTTTQAQFDAMVSFAFNCGETNFRGSSILRLHLAGLRAAKIDRMALYRASINKAHPTTIPVAFVRWSNANGRWMLGLFRRRMSEAMIYAGMEASDAISVCQSFRP